MNTEAINNLERSVELADANLNSVVNVLNQVEKTLNISASLENGVNNGGSSVRGTSDVEEFSVMELLESMTEVKNEYQHLRKDLQEVQQLQREMSQSLRYQMQVMNKTCNILKKRIQLNVEQPPN